ncbi:E3 ubiquitin-protein ligase TRIM35 [Pangasianodon hypophthalmus]|uniref:E3 ubiquitin-protein ligase TRIM35 n=1 Tax=Pangasianodon hypophthalmus TaxID=310915 RepID=UPI000EFFE415|nr:E3 ubiquitin-protein ligase TRIM35 [Pangasianodon hypophthalmus]
MAATSHLSEEEFLCPVCYDIFSNPVLLSCSHSLCKACLQRLWEIKESPECPVCRRKSSKPEPPLNLALKKLCESFLQSRHHRSSVPSDGLCKLHNEKLKLFCLEDQQPVCVVCQTSKRHKNHEFCPIDEVLYDIKEGLRAALDPLQKSQTHLETAKQNYNRAALHIKSQAQCMERQIKKEFEKLHQFLREEEAARIAALKQEEEQKSQRIQRKIDETNREIARLQDIIKKTEKEMDTGDVAFLQNVESTVKEVQRTTKIPETETNMLINVSKHISNLKIRVCVRMQEIFQYTSVTLDPNTAHSQLHVSDDLTTVEHRKQELPLPDNPERFDSVTCVLGCEGFKSGSHYWDVEVGDSNIWELGVIGESAPRKKNSFSNAVCSMSYNKGSYHTLCPGQTGDIFRAKDKPQRVRVHLDWNKGKVTFIDLITNTRLHTITHNFTERVFPFFYNSSPSRPMKILPIKQTAEVKPYI